MGTKKEKIEKFSISLAIWPGILLSLISAIQCEHCEAIKSNLLLKERPIG